VASATARGVAGAHQAFVPAASTGFVSTAVLLVALAGFWTLAGTSSGSAPATMTRAAIGAAIVGVLVVLPVRVALAARRRAVIAALPTDGSIGAGEVQARLYAQTWRLDLTRSALSLAVVVVGLVYLVLTARGLGLMTGPGTSSLPWIGAVLFVFFALAAYLILRQGLARGRVAEGRRPAPPTARPGEIVARFTSEQILDRVGEPTSAPGEVIQCWGAPVARALTSGQPMLRLGRWSGPDGVNHDLWVQNVLVVTDRAVYALVVIPHELQSVIADPSYAQVKTALFMSGTRIREDAMALLSQGLDVAVASDERNIRFARPDITSVVVNGVKVVISTREGVPDSYVFNHADAAAGFIAQAAAAGLPVRQYIDPGQPHLAPSLYPETSLAAAHMTRIPTGLFRGRSGVVLVVGLLVLLLGANVTLSGFGALVATTHQSSLTGRTTGTIELVNRHSSKNQSSRCDLRYSYTVAGSTYRQSTSSDDVGLCAADPGDPVPVAYSVTDPARGDIAASGRGGAVGRLVLGLVLAMVGAVTAFRKRWIPGLRDL
jgi:hypothetical protein